MASSSNGDWCTIESDPGVFTCLVETLGARNVEFAELWGLDDDSLRHLVRPTEGGVGADDDGGDAAVHGLIFLFKWQSQSSSSHHNNEEVKEEEAGEGGGSSRGTPLTGDDVPGGLFFARQVTHNACATQAILSVLFNAPGAIVDADEGENDDENENESNGGEKKRGDDDDGGKRLVLGKTLSNFKSFTMGFPPDLRGEAIGSSDEIRSAHNSFGRAEDAFLSDPSRAKRAATDDDDVFHFIAYVPREEDGCVYELDGLQPGPIRVGSYKKEDGGGEENGEGGGGATMDWIRVARDAIQSRLANYPPAEIKFNLMATVQDRRTCLSSRLDALAAIGVEESDPAMLAVRAGLGDEEAKRGRWAMENARRRHNYLPFCVELLRGLAGSGKFESLVERARESAGEKRKRAEEWKKRSSSSGGE